jgi:hypothetical protein
VQCFDVVHIDFGSSTCMTNEKWSPLASSGFQVGAQSQRLCSVRTSLASMFHLVTPSRRCESSIHAPCAKEKRRLVRFVPEDTSADGE